MRTAAADSGNASGDSLHGIDGNRIWQGNITVAGFNAGGHGRHLTP
ncbi:hypothetical protein [Streptomyces chartreusis]